MGSVPTLRFVILAAAVSALAQTAAAFAYAFPETPNETDLSLRLRPVATVTPHRGESDGEGILATETADLRVHFEPVMLMTLAQDAGEHAGALHEVEEELFNRIALFLGATSNNDGTNFSLGFEYERKLSDVFGIGAVIEGTPSHREPVLAAPVLYIRPWSDLALLVAPGVVFENGGSFLVRIGVGWDFELGGGFTLAPAVNFDFVSGSDNAIVWGVVTSYWF